jgi:hypothetical protein
MSAASSSPPESGRGDDAAATPNLWVVVDPASNNLLGEFDYRQQAEEFMAEMDDPNLVIVETRDDA